MTDVATGERATTFEAVSRLHADYARLMDGGDAVGFSRLFGAAGTLALPDREVTGPAALTEFAEQANKGVHVQGVAALERAPDGTIRATSSFVFVNATTYAVTAGEYRDELTEVDGEPTFARRQIVIRLRSADQPAE